MMYTVEQITQAIDALATSDKERLLRALVIPSHANESDDGFPNAASDYIVVYDGGDEDTQPTFAIMAKRGQAKQVARVTASVEPGGHEAHYVALREGLQGLLAWLTREGRDPGQVAVEVRGNSRLVHQQVRGLWKASGGGLQALKQEVASLLSCFLHAELVEVPVAHVTACLSE